MTYPEDLKIIRKKSLPSTNLFLKENLEKYMDDSPLLIIAGEQTSGKGRGENSWFSPDKSGIYISLLFKLPADLEIGLLPMCTGNSIVESLKKTSGIICNLKWPNDIEFNGKKIGGILTENSFLGETVISIIGIGVNINNRNKEFPSRISETATSLSIICKKDFNIEQIIMEIVTEITNRIDKLKKGNVDKIADEYRNLIKHKKGDIISFHHSGKSVKGIFFGINDSGGVILKTESGETKIFYSGEILTDL